MMSRLRFLLQLLTKSWQRPWRIAILSQMISKRSVCIPVFVYTFNPQVQLPIENTDLVPQLKQVTSLCQSHPTHSKFFQSATATWMPQIPQDISSERCSSCTIWG